MYLKLVVQIAVEEVECCTKDKGVEKENINDYSEGLVVALTSKVRCYERSKILP